MKSVRTDIIPGLLMMTSNCGWTCQWRPIVSNTQWFWDKTDTRNDRVDEQDSPVIIISALNVPFDDGQHNRDYCGLAFVISPSSIGWVLTSLLQKDALV